MKIGALAPWFGSKRNLAPAIVEALGPHRVYWEPFCGSMSVLLAKPPCVMETVNDLHGDLVNLARVVQHSTIGPALYRRLRRVLFSEAQFNELAATLRSDEPAPDVPDLDRAFAYFVCTWMGRNGLAGTRSYNHHFCVRYTANGGHSAKRWRSAVQSISAWRRRLANATILSRNGFELLGRIEDAAGVAIYLDPPYLVKGSKYVHDFEPADHERLADAAKKFKRTRVVISYYDHPRLEELYPGWSRREIVVSKAMANQLTADAREHAQIQKKATEVLLINESEGMFG